MCAPSTFLIKAKAIIDFTLLSSISFASAGICFLFMTVLSTQCFIYRSSYNKLGIDDIILQVEGGTEIPGLIRYSIVV